MSNSDKRFLQLDCEYCDSYLKMKFWSLWIDFHGFRMNKAWLAVWAAVLVVYYQGKKHQKQGLIWQILKLNLVLEIWEHHT